MIGVNQKIIFCFAVMMGASASANVWGPPPDLGEVTSTNEAPATTHQEALTDYLADAIPMPEGVEHGEEMTPAEGSIETVTTNFKAKFNSVWSQCNQGCKPVQPWIDGDASHCKKASCHNSRQAVDIHTISCGGTIHKASSKLFDKIAVCLRGKARVLWKVKNHHKHFHLEFGGCNKKRGCGK